MLPSLCRAMAANPSVSRLRDPPGGVRQGRRRFTLGFHAASWQHRYLDCGTLISERSLRSRHQCRAVGGGRQEGAANGRRLHGR
jgi:hypothetical protein